VNPFVNRLRGLLAILVAAYHASLLCTTLPTVPDHFQTMLAPVSLFLGLNYVIGFIVISGFCIARSTLNRPFSVRQYAAQRASRIYPSLIACAVFAGVIEMSLHHSAARMDFWAAGIDVQSFVWTALGLGGFFGQFGSYAPTYTVSYELLYYALWGAAFAVLPLRLIVPVCLLAIPILFSIMPSYFHFALVIFSVWLMGAAVAIWQSNVTRIASAIPLWAIWLVCGLLYIWGNSAVLDHAGIDVWHYPGSLVTIPCGILFTAVLAGHLSRPSSRLEIDDWLGEISYPLFLVHGPTMVAVVSAVKALGIHPDFGVMFCVLIGCAFAVAAMVVVFVERPVMRWRRNFSADTVAGKGPIPSALPAE
jgi:peptidoglycan/LPS O-acetylase OafA/YrhL